MFKRKSILVPGIAICFLTGVGAQAEFLGGGFDLTRHTVDGGAEMAATSGAFELSRTIGQPDTATAVSGGLLSGDIGLTLAHQLIHRNGGELTVRAGAEGGTEFSVTLQAAQEEEK